MLILVGHLDLRPVAALIRIAVDARYGIPFGLL